MDNQFDINKFNSFLDAASKQIMCDSECQKLKEAEDLKNKYLNAKSNLLLAEPQYENAKKTYYTFVSGENGYNDMLEKELDEKANIIISKYKDSFKNDLDNAKLQIDTYNGVTYNVNNIIELHDKYKTDNKRLFKSLKKNTNDVLTNERQTYYEDQEINTLSSFYYYILLIIYIIVVGFFIFFSLTRQSQTSFRTKLILIILFCILPFISTWILGKIIYVIYFIFGLLPKNVYK